MENTFRNTRGKCLLWLLCYGALRSTPLGRKFLRVAGTHSRPVKTKKAPPIAKALDPPFYLDPNFLYLRHMLFVGYVYDCSRNAKYTFADIVPVVNAATELPAISNNPDK